MKKRMLSLLCVLALCLGLLPVTALAAPPGDQVIYVGNENVTSGGYWTTDSNGNVTAYTGGDTPTDNYIHYDVANNTLTLHNATIKESVSTNTSTFIAGAAIGVLNQNGDAELTITLEGTNTIAEVGKGIYVLANSTGGATLTITGDGSLDASASQTGIWVQSNNGNGALFIQNAKVEATGTNTAGYGVNVQSSNSSTAALTVDGGSLTASGSPGILYDSIGSGTVPKTTALTISNSAIVDARGGGIGAGLLQDLKKVSPADDSVGIVFGLDLSDSKAGAVYGDVTLDESLTINQGETLTVPSGAELNCNGKLTNNGTILASGGTVTGSLSGGSTTVTTPSISVQPQNKEVTAGKTATFTVEASAGSETPTYQWQQKTAASGSDWTDINSATSDSYTTEATTTSMNNYQYRCVVTSASGVSVISSAATLTVETYTPPTTYTIRADVTPAGAGSVSGGGSYTEGTSVTLTATNNPGYRFVGWMEGDQTVSTDTTYAFPANSNRSLTAQFDRISSGGGDSDPTYSITLPSRVTGGELKLSRRYAEKGETVTITAIPDEGYELDTLTVTDSKGKEIDLTHKGGNEYTFKMPAGRVEIEVSFREIEVELPFTDVPEGAWYADAAAYVYEHGLMAGTSATTFAPDATTSRSMIATILWRMAGSPVVNYAMDYTDVAQGQWYSEAIRWAASEGIVGGYGNGLFGTNDPITREQFAAMLYRFAQEQGYDVSIGENTNILSYTDVADLSEYAISAMQWAVGAGIINGTGDGSTLTPQGQATRAQAAVMLMRFCEEYVTW